MLRVGLRLILLSFVLFMVGFASLSSVWFEVSRLLGVASLSGGMFLLLIWYARTPVPTKEP